MGLYKKVMERERAPKLMTVKEVRMAVGQDRLSKGMAYGLARVLGVRMGRRLLIPSKVVEDLLEGRLPPEVLEAALWEARKMGGSGKKEAEVSPGPGHARSLGQTKLG